METGRRRTGRLERAEDDGALPSLSATLSLTQVLPNLNSERGTVTNPPSFTRRVAYPVYTPKNISSARGSQRVQRTRVRKVFRTKGRIRSRPAAVATRKVGHNRPLYAKSSCLCPRLRVGAVPRHRRSPRPVAQRHTADPRVPGVDADGPAAVRQTPLLRPCRSAMDRHAVERRRRRPDR